MKRSCGIVLCLLVLAGCASNAPTRYYVLSPLAGETKVTAEESCATVGIGPVKLPEYVNRPEIVTRTTPNELVLSYFDLWAEPLNESIPRILAENVSRLICAKEVMLFPWRPSRAPDYRVEVEFVHLDGNLGKTVSLEAWWSVSSGNVRVVRRSAYSEPVSGQDYDALVQAESRALVTLSRDIAGAIK